MTVFVEHLTFPNWIAHILPALLRRKEERGGPSEPCAFFDATPLGEWAARVTARIFGISLARLEFRLVEVRDEKGLLVRLRVAVQDLADLRLEVMKDPLFAEVLQGEQPESRLSTYLGKAATLTDLYKRETFLRALLVVQVAAWSVRKEDPDGDSVGLLFFEKRPWGPQVARYAAGYRIQVVPVWPAFIPREFARSLVPARTLQIIRFLREGSWLLWLRLFGKRVRGFAFAQRRLSPQIAVEYYGHLNLSEPQRYSDLFFWQRSDLPADSLVVTFGLAADPLDEQKWRELTEHGIRAVALQPRATTLAQAPVFIQRSHLRKREMPNLVRSRGLEARWLARRVRDYQETRAYWTHLFSREQVKIYDSWFKYGPDHCAIADALQSLGGVTAIYQRAYEELPFAEAMISADLVFGFSALSAQVEQRNGSTIPYFVTIGYPGDHRFPLLREEASRVRQALEKKGARRILSFTDENSGADARWHTGHELQQENYAFLLEKLLSNPWLGLVIKPKVPSTLAKRLGPVR
jgi:hypothetical protein